MKILISTLIATLLLINANSQENNVLTISNQAEISLLTCSPGDELYSLFGHSAMRLKDPVNNIDAVFNYGTFTFNDDFYYNFTMGKLNYKLGISSMDRFIRLYNSEGRGVIEQTLDLDSIQKQSIANFLNWNSQPENKYYLYDFFYDNCSSILRDVLDTALQGQVTFADLTKASQPTYRNMIDSYLIYHPWGDFGIDLGLGLPCDKTPNYLEYMFLPDELHEAYDKATIGGHPLVKEERMLLENNGLKYEWSITQPVPLFWLLFGVIGLLSAIGLRLQKRFMFIDILLLLVLGLAGALLFFLWFITDHTATANNFNMLWALPTHLLIIPFLWNSKIRRSYFMIIGSILLLTLIFFPLLPQMLHLATIPLMLTMLTRSYVNFKLP
ncbi:DUF4105 domain-containing protein [bacterium]|nr:DUF4105 domain-containing protein [bacterium]